MEIDKFKLPNINLNALPYIDLINRQGNVIKPPILKTIPDENISLFVE